MKEAASSGTKRTVSSLPEAPRSTPYPLVHVIQHTADEGLGRLARALAERGVEARVCRADLGEPLPRDLSTARGLVVLGGPMGVYESDRHPHLRDELRLIERALAVSAPVLGICLGSQLLASVLGARVRPSGAKEIGWFPVTLERIARQDPLFERAPKTFDAPHWHGDVFDLPRDAVHLARSEATEHQAFRFGEATYGLLFHLEAEVDTIRRMASAFASELAPAGVDGPKLIPLSEERAPATAVLAEGVFEAWAEML